MELFDVYPLYELEIVEGKGAWVTDHQNRKYLDFYGGHAVISIGHGHVHYVQAVKRQLDKIGFYSNSVKNPLQRKLASLLGQQSGIDHFQLFLINSGAEANENALKLASFHTGRSKIISFKHGFHGRTSAAVNVTDNEKIIAPLNRGFENIRIEIGDIQALKEELVKGDTAAVIIEGIQGVAGIYEAPVDFLREIRALTEEYGTLLIMDEVQAGYGRSGHFFSYQIADLQPDLVTIAKGMGNGFPIGGLLIHPEIRASHGLLGTTFGGNHLACAAAISVLEVIAQEQLVNHARQMGDYILESLAPLKGIVEVRGRGLMIGIQLNQSAKAIRKKLLFEHSVFLGSAAQPETIRLLPPLNVTKEEVNIFLAALEAVLN